MMWERLASAQELLCERQVAGWGGWGMAGAEKSLIRQISRLHRTMAAPFTPRLCIASELAVVANSKLAVLAAAFQLPRVHHNRYRMACVAPAAARSVVVGQQCRSGARRVAAVSPVVRTAVQRRVSSSMRQMAVVAAAAGNGAAASGKREPRCSYVVL